MNRSIRRMNRCVRRMNRSIRPMNRCIQSNRSMHSANGSIASGNGSRRSAYESIHSRECIDAGRDTLAAFAHCTRGYAGATQSTTLRSVIGWLSGAVKKLDATTVLVAVGGVGYEVHISLQTYYRIEGKREVELDIYTHVREDALALYGFASAEEKNAFEK